MINITGKTVICGIIGDPVEHTLSPVMHNAAFRALGLDYAYLPFHVLPERLPLAISGMRGLNLRGLNVTIPHKVAVIPLLDRVDPLASSIGAVNTVVNEANTLIGYNTDAAGALQALLKNGVEPGGKKTAIIGAGGAARAVAFALAERGARITILNRSRDKAHEIATRISQTFPDRSASARQLNAENLKAVLSEADIIVNTTNIGMSPHVNESPIPGELIEARHTVFDVVYSPALTRLLLAAREAGAQTIGGLDMLAWQGALAFEMWTGRKAPLDVMRKALAGALHED